MSARPLADPAQAQASPVGSARTDPAGRRTAPAGPERLPDPADTTTAPRVRRATLPRRLLGALLPWTSLALLIALWAGASATGRLPTSILPSPGTVAVTAVELVTTGVLLPSLGTSFVRAGSGAALGLAAGLTLGLVAGLSRLAERLVDKPVQMVRAIPFTALVPLFIIWFGIGEAPKVLLVAVGVTVPVYLNTFSGIRDVDARLVEVGRICGLSRWRIGTTVLLPGALPSILVGVRFALGIAWVALIVAETLAAGSGIGALMTSAREYTRTDVMLVCIFLYAALGVATDTVVRILEHVLLRWRVVFSGD